MSDSTGVRGYQIHEFARLTGLTVRALQHYDHLGLLKPVRSRAGHRTYSDQDLQALVQILAPPGLRGRVVGLFNTSMLGLRAGSGVTVGVLGAVIGIEWSLALSAAAVVAVAVGLLIADVRARPAH